MKNIILAFELFSIYFCAGCCLLHKPTKSSDRVSLKPSTEEENSNLDTSSDEGNRHTRTIEAVSTAKEATEITVLPHVAGDEISPNAEEDWEINFKLLSLTACRGIAGELSRLDKERLGISQKVNGKDKPLAQLQQEIKSRCKRYPEEVNPIVRRRCNEKAKVKRQASEGKTVAIASGAEVRPIATSSRQQEMRGESIA